MSSSLYRGKLHTNAEIKGPFTEAADSLDEGAFRVLAQCANESASADIHVHERKDGSTMLIFVLDGVWLTIDSNSIVEIGEGAA